MGFDLKFLRDLSEINTPFHWAGCLALAAQYAVVHIQDCNLRDGGGERNVYCPDGAHVQVKCGGQIDWTGIFTQTASCAGIFIHVAWFFQNSGSVAILVFFYRRYFAVCEQTDVLMMGDGRHLWRGDTTAAIEGGEDLAQCDHFAPNAGFLFHKCYLVALICQI